jgi:hypothetical protein
MEPGELWAQANPDAAPIEERDGLFTSPSGVSTEPSVKDPGVIHSGGNGIPGGGIKPSDAGAGTGLAGSFPAIGRLSFIPADITTLEKLVTVSRISLASILVVIAAIVGGIVTATNPHTLSFADYWQYLVIGGGITAVGRGLDNGSGTAP